METKPQQTSSKDDGGGKEVAKGKTAASPYSKYSFNMVVFFVVLWVVCFMTFHYTAAIREAVPKWVEDAIALSNSNDTCEAQSDIYAEHSFSYTIYDSQVGVPLMVDFKEMPDEKKEEHPQWVLLFFCV